MEIWKSIGEHPNYEVSNYGNVRRSSPGMGTRVGKILRPGLNGGGYPQVLLDRKPVRVHRLVAREFIGPCPEDKECNHRDGVKTNNHVDNLEYITPSENTLHAYRVLHVPNRKGEAHGRAKLTDDSVKAIRLARSLGERTADLAKRYRVSVGTIYFACSRDTWKHI